ncbi:hypothetical protein ACFFRR_003065 [Megaselia abdita]
MLNRRRNLINDKCAICSKPILFRKNSKYPKNDLCSICWKDYGKRVNNVRRQSHSPGPSPRFPKPDRDEAFTWGELFQGNNMNKYSKTSEDCKVSSTTFIPERPPLNVSRYENPFRTNTRHYSESESFPRVRVHLEPETPQRIQLDSETFPRVPLKKKLAVPRHKEIVFDGETHSNKKFKLVSTRKELERETTPDDDSFSSREDCGLVIDTEFIEEPDNDGRTIEVLYREPFPNRDPRLKREPFLSYYEESINIKKERIDGSYPEPSLNLNLNPFMLEVSVEGVHFMAELDTYSVDLQISMEVAEIIQKEVMKNPARIDHRNGWANIYPGKIVNVSIDINNFLHSVPGTLRSDISYKIILGREVLVTFGYNFSVCGLPVKQKA